MVRYYVDTCVYRDHLEKRVGHDGRPLGKYAEEFFLRVIKRKDVVVFSDHVVSELSLCGCEQAFLLFEALGILEKVDILDSYWDENLSEQKQISFADCLHAIIARENNCVLITQNTKDFIVFSDFLDVLKPEQTLLL